MASRPSCTSLPPIVSFDAQQSVLRVTGEEDRSTSGKRRRPISAALKAECDVNVDLSELRLADKSLMLDLAVLAQRLRADGCEMRLRRPQPYVRTLISVAGLDRLPSVEVVPRLARA